jgi:hypothetical protein
MADCGRGDGGHGPGDAASDHGGRGASCRDDGGAREAAVGRVSGGRRRSARRVGRGRERRGPGSCRDVRRAVSTVALSRCVGTARGGHAAAARCCTGPARHATTDRSGPLVSDFRIKIHPEGN